MALDVNTKSPSTLDRTFGCDIINRNALFFIIASTLANIS